jgi:signal transduction histidine kinase
VFKNAAATAILRGPDQVERLRVTLIDWMSTGLLGPHDAAFFDKRSRIGRRHVAIGLPQHFIFTAMSVMRTAYSVRIEKLYGPSDALAVVRSVDKLFDIELALMLRNYQLDSEEKRAARERAMLADRLIALQTLTAGLAHEVRNPLNAAKLQLQLLERRLRRSTSESTLVQPSEIANQELDRLTDLLDEFLSFARAPELQTGRHDVVAIAKKVVSVERPFAERQKIELALSPDQGTLMAHVDASKLHQIMQALLRNALEAAPPKGRVALDLRIEENELHVRVRDDGNGMSDQTKRRVFEPFFTTKDNGTGMGMAIVHTFVTMHGGRIDIATSPSGTTVDVALPQPT